jgi:hypothetical protein
VAYRQGATAPFALHTYAAPISGGEASSAKVAINADGMAVVAIRAADALVAATRKTVADWPANVETVRGTGVQDADPTVAIDAAGNVFSAFTYDAGGGVMIVRTGYRPGGGGWQESQNLSPATAGSVASFPDVALNAPGAALLVWKQVGTGLNNVSGRLGTTGTGIWGPIETVNAFGPDVPVAAIADNGIAVAAWEHDTGGNNVDQARVRSAGAAGTWGDIHDLDALHANDTAVSLSADGPGDFATISAPFSAALAYKPALVSVYDAAPPVVTPAVTGNLSAGGTVTLAATATDAWSTAGTPAWAFGDGGSGAGSSVPHVYSAAGTYTAHVTVSDASGNTFGTDVPVVVKEAAKATLVGAKFRAKWKQSRVSGTLLVTGTTPITGTYAFNISKGTTRKIHVSLKLNAGPFSRSIRLPVKFLPGVYHVAIAPVSKIIKPATLDATLAAPVEGVVDTVKLTRTRKAESARFHFAAVPKTGKLTLSWYRLVKGKRARLASASKARKATVTGSLSLSRQHGSFVVVLTRAGKVIAQTAFKIR